VRPREQQPGAVLVEQAGALKEADDLVAEELLGVGGVDISAETLRPGVGEWTS